MKLPEGTPVLDINSPTFTEDFCEAIGVKPGEKLHITTPQFERTDGVKVDLPNYSPEDWAALPKKDAAELKALGIGVWNTSEAGTHYLFPKEWYSIIPNGMMVKFIDGDEEAFEAGVTDDDYRYGCLAYGFFVPTEKVAA